MKYLVCCAFVAIALSGCGVMKAPLDLGGSKGDGTVILGVNVDEFDRVNWDGAQAKATKRCKAWGYSDAEAFEGIRERCIEPFGWYSGCARKEVSRTYQCID